MGLALAIGLLIGVERGWQERKGAAGSRTAGIRTYALIGLFGGVWGALTPVAGPIALGLAAAAFAGTFGFFQWREQVEKKDFSVTSAVVSMLTFALGVYAVLGDMAAAAAVAVATVAVLAARRDLHEFLRRMTWPELRSAIVLLAMTVVALPLLPDRTIDPWNAINPYQLWLLTVLIGVVSFIGYVAVKIAGERQGLLFAGLAGGLASSTVVTLTFSRQAAKAKPEIQRDFATGIVAAWTMSVLRMTALAGIVAPAVVQPLALPVGAAAAVLLLATIYLYRQPKGDGGSKLDLGNPLDPVFVVRFGLLLTIIAVAAKLLTQYFGQTGLLSLAGLSGIADVDPITLSVAKMTGGTLSATQAAAAILLAGGVNLIVRMVLAIWFGGRRFGFMPAVAGAAALAAGAAAYAFSTHLIY